MEITIPISKHLSHMDGFTGATRDALNKFKWWGKSFYEYSYLPDESTTPIHMRKYIFPEINGNEPLGANNNGPLFKLTWIIYDYLSTRTLSHI